MRLWSERQLDISQQRSRNCEKNIEILLKQILEEKTSIFSTYFLHPKKGFAI